MITPNDCIKKFGLPVPKNACLTLWQIPTELQFKPIPKQIYVNTLMIIPLSKAFKSLIDSGAVKELKTFDGCFNIRCQRDVSVYSLHSWAIAIDLNAADNPLYSKTTTFTNTFIKCFKDAGFDWGGDWKFRKDPMHFQLSNF